MVRNEHNFGNTTYNQLCSVSYLNLRFRLFLTPYKILSGMEVEKP